MTNALTVDVEDWYHVSSFRGTIKISDWDKCPSRVVENTMKILDIFERESVEATFFVLGYVAEKFPDIVKEIDQRGHEICTHGYIHESIPHQNSHEFALDLKKSISVLEGIIKKKVLGYRAPSWSITSENMKMVFDELIRNGMRYDSSIYPIKIRYGVPDAPRFAYQPTKDFYEIPLSTIRILNTNVPIGGGLFLRILPYEFTRWSIHKINQTGKETIVYFHTWEIDPQTPKIKASFKSKFIHYYNICKMECRIRALLNDFRFSSIRNVFLHSDESPEIAGMKHVR